MVAYENLKTKQKSSQVILKVVEVAYRNSCLREFISLSNLVSQRWSSLELVANESAHKQSFHCDKNYFLLKRLSDKIQVMNIQNCSFLVTQKLDSCIWRLKNPIRLSIKTQESSLLN